MRIMGLAIAGLFAELRCADTERADLVAGLDDLWGKRMIALGPPPRC
jgi:hypothetical protein